MSLIRFHRALIACAIVFCFGYAAWEIYARGVSLLAVVFVLLGIGLGWYLKRLRQFLGLEDESNVGHHETE